MANLPRTLARVIQGGRQITVVPKAGNPRTTNQMRLLFSPRLLSKITVAAGLLASGLLTGCTEMLVVDPGPVTARVRFRLDQPGDVVVWEAVPADCYVPTDATAGRIVNLSYNTVAIRWIVESRLHRLGMPGAEKYSSISYSERNVRAAKPIALRFMMIGGGNGGHPTGYGQWSVEFEPGKDYEVVVVNDGDRLRDVRVSRIVQGGTEARTVPVVGVARTSFCSG